MRHYYAAVLVVAAVLGGQEIQAQTTTDALSIARRALSQQDYAAASATYQQVLKRQPGTAGDYYRAAEAAARNQEPKAALQLLKQAVDKGYFSAEAIADEENFASLTTQAAWLRLLARARTKQQRHETPFDPQLVMLLKKIELQDQNLRKLAKKAERDFGPNATQVEAAMRQQDYFDLLTIRQVDSLIARHGYPGKLLVGEYQKDVAFFVIQHNPDAKYLPLLTAAADQGEFSWSALALLIDRLKTEQGEKQVYGSQSLFDRKGHGKLYPIEDEVRVNERRAKVGLEPLEEYLHQHGLVYQAPTAAGNLNPPELYVDFKEGQEAEERPSVELVGGYETLYAGLRYPEAARQQNVSGHVTVQLTIDKDGVPKDLAVVNGLGHGCDEEALRAMRAARFINAAGEDHEIRMELPFPYEPARK
ncbi:energy transducer TonB [Hymenobacter defluvii]|uniref:Energy transducer TonB n=1 Tax=Hymenobacter defluvii TaxID=2054411 RepID=A0ABS3TGU9_9BACT|nr:energy transducer TonB [Hymenobacter defluvii]MBO3271950.1 energy transducer TonB [Hymenobacter defluvii]